MIRPITPKCLWDPETPTLPIAVPANDIIISGNGWAIFEYIGHHAILEKNSKISTENWITSGD